MASAGRKSLRWAGLSLIGAGVIGFPTHTVFAMSSRWMEAGFNDTMHIILSGVFSLSVFTAIVFSAVAYRGWFRFYSIATLLVLVGFGAASSFAMAGIEDNLTPWAGGFERINAYTYFAWLVVLAVTLMRRPVDGRPPEGDKSGSRAQGAGSHTEKEIESRQPDSLIGLGRHPGRSRGQLPTGGGATT